ncbi:MAG: MFS transporter [Methanobacteriota archaeon]
MRRLLIGTSLISVTVGATALVIPLYASSLGASYTEIGMLGVAYVVLGAIFSIPLGRISDTRGRRGFMILGFISTAIALTLYSFAYTIIWLVVIRAIQGLTETLVWINTQGAMADNSNLAERGKVMGLYGRAWGVGIGFGPIMASILYVSIGAFYTFLLNGALAFVSVAIVMTASLPEHKPAQQKLKTPGINTLFFAGLMYIGVVAIIINILPVYATKGLGLSIFYVGLLITVFSLSRAFLFKPFGELSDRMGHRSLILAGIIGSSLALMSFVLVSGLLTLAVVLVLLSISASAIYPSVMGALSKVGDGSNFGYLLGIFNLLMMVGWGIFPGIGGAIADAYGPTSTFVISGVILLASAVILWRILPKDKNYEAKARNV